MRREILRLVEAFPGVSQGKVGRFMDCDVTAYVDALASDGLLISEIKPAMWVTAALCVVMLATAQ